MSRTRALTRDEIKRINTRRLTEIPVEEWEGSVYVATLAAGEVLDFGESLKGQDRTTSLAMQLARFIVDENGVALYTVESAKADLVDTGMRKPLERILQIAMKENGMLTEESIKGNSSPSPSV